MILPTSKDGSKANMTAPENDNRDHMIPGITNINSVGTSPLKRMAHQMVTLQRRDGRYN